MNRLFLLLLAPLLFSCNTPDSNRDPLDDEAMVRARETGRSPADAAREWFYPREIHNYFAGMDSIAVLPDGTAYQLLDVPQYRPDPAAVERREPVTTDAEILGRNTWMMWAGGNEAFWDWLSRQYGFLDLLRLIDSRHRSTRFRDAGLINEPGMLEAVEADEFGLWLDVPADPRLREWRAGYVRRAFGLDADTSPGTAGYGASGGPLPARMLAYPEDRAYDPDIPPPEIYGLSSGVIGLRLFPNPEFDAKARDRWNARRYYGDPIGDPELVRPYRVGMSCAFCHASYHPLNPPHDIVNPEWDNISGNIGAQYLRTRAVFGNLLTPDNFIYHLLDSQPPGSIDTSLIASDNINNPNTMNSVFSLPQRVLVSLRNPQEQLSAQSATQPSVWYEPGGNPATSDAPSAELVRLAQKYWAAMLGSEDEADRLVAELAASNDASRRVPRILLDGADSIGAWGALARVYLNIGTNYEQWNTLHEPVIGYLPQRPFTIDNAERHSVYWHATQDRVGPLRDYFLKITPPMPLLAATGGGASADTGRIANSTSGERLRLVDTSQLQHGREVFAENCIVCHSSVQPPERHEQWRIDAGRSGYFWDRDPGRWLRDPDYLAWAKRVVETPAFWEANYLSTDYRVPVNLVGTNACRAMATNALAGSVWSEFASESYQQMPSVGAITYFNPYKGEAGGEDRFMPRHRAPQGAPAGGGGPGFYRVPTLASIWATAPLLHNNSLGLFTNDPSIHGRLAAFDDAVRKLLWPERRLLSSSYNEATPARLAADRGLIWRTPQPTHLNIEGRYLPQILGARLSFLNAIGDRLPWINGLSPWLQPLPSAALLLLGFVLLWLARGRIGRTAGYGAIVAALLAGGVIYFINGGFGGVRIGPIPAGTPVNLLANTNPQAERDDLLNAIATTRRVLTEIESTRPGPERRDEIMRTEVAPVLMSISKCPDFVMDRGHYFTWFDNMTDADKEALIELLKTF